VHAYRKRPPEPAGCRSSCRRATAQFAPTDLSRQTALAMIFKLAKAAEKAGVASMAHNQLPKVILGVEFADGIEVIGPHAQAAA